MCTACAQSPPQHGKRHKTQKIMEEMARLEIQFKNALAEVAVLQTMDDMMSAFVLSNGGARSCVQCEYLNVRENAELAVWEAENSDTIERWLRWRRCHLFKTVSIGGCGHVTMKWQVEDRKKRADCCLKCP